MERLRRNDGIDGVPLQRNVAGKIGLEKKSFSVGLDDRSGQAIAIFQGYLIGKRPCSANA
jgi:hypothetical protein